MKKLYLTFLVFPLFCQAGNAIRAFEKFDPFFDYSETFYYGNVQTSFDTPLAGTGVRYKDEEIAFDASLSGIYGPKAFTPTLQADASLFYYPFTDHLYLGAGAGIQLSFGHTIAKMSFLRATFGLEYRSLRRGNYFVEGLIQSPTDFELKDFKLTPGFRLGIGF